MSKIKVLPDSLANKIAAGEVVERPASVVKELLENALDAGARRINIAIETGGKKLIRIIDDGEGMTRDDAIIAFERHATSKLRTASDLEAITSLGFRGEALPSIAAVSRLILRTKTAPDAIGTEVEFNGGKLIAVRQLAWPGGSELEVKDLFLNMPARRKFLKGDATESYHIVNLVQHYALANPGVAFLLIKDGRESLRVAETDSGRDRAYQVLGSALLGKLIEVNHESAELKISGWISNPQEQRSSRDAQYLFVNRRFVRDQLVGRALSEAYRSMMPSGAYPAAVLFINLPPGEVDVNVHPAKTEVRFLREGAVMLAIRDAVAKALTSSRPVTRVPMLTTTVIAESRDAVEVEISSASARDIDFELSPQPARAQQVKQSPLSLSFSDSEQEPERAESYRESHQSISAVSTPLVEIESRVAEDTNSAGLCSEGAEPDLIQSIFSAEIEANTTLPWPGHGIKPLGQIRDSYIVATDEEGLLLIDQHVAHERVLFEQFRDDKLSRPHAIQPLLIPETLDLSPAEAEAFEAVSDALERIGIEVMQLSGRTIAVKTAPAGLAPGDVVSIVRHTINVVEAERRSFSVDHLRDQLAASLACKAAIKVNMPLTMEKMQWLIDELMKTGNRMTCPHGRPIIMRMGLREIERGFKRPV